MDGRTNGRTNGRTDSLLELAGFYPPAKNVVKLLDEVNMKVYKDFYEPMNLKTTLLTVKRPV